MTNTDQILEVDIDVRLRNAAVLNPDKLTVADSNRSLTWNEFDTCINKITHALITQGVHSNDRIVLLSQNCVEYVEAFFGGLRAGACITPLSTLAC